MYPTYVYELKEKLLLSSPIHVGISPVHIPTGLEPSPEHILVPSPTRENPVSQVYVARVPKSKGEVVSFENTICPLAI